MIKNLFKKMLIKSGKNYHIDDRIPNKLVYLVFYTRAIMLVRGYLKTGKKIFIGKNTKIINS
jgi:hypothetical protein